jgi:hypothetical protein
VITAIFATGEAIRDPRSTIRKQQTAGSKDDAFSQCSFSCDALIELRLDSFEPTETWSPHKHMSIYKTFELCTMYVRPKPPVVEQNDPEG